MMEKIFPALGSVSATGQRESLITSLTEEVPPKLSGVWGSFLIRWVNTYNPSMKRAIAMISQQANQSNQAIKGAITMISQQTNQSILSKNNPNCLL